MLFLRPNLMTLKVLAARLSARAGLKLALVQTAVVVTAFVLAGELTQIAVERISQASIRTHVAGEAASLDDEYRQKGSQHLPYTVAKRSRLWRGFDYRLSAANGTLLAGRLPPGDGALGWAPLLDRSKGGDRHYLSLTKVMPDGTRLTVGQDVAVEAGEMAAIRRTLLACGALGLVFCLGASHLFSRGTWRRMSVVIKAAHRVSAGDLTIRADLHDGPPRDDVDTLASVFNGMLDQIGGLVSQVRQVSTDIAHDLRTPLTRVGHKLERLRFKAAGDPELLHAVEDLEADLSNVLRTFDALLQLSEIEASAFRPASTASPIQIADLGVVATRVAEAYRPDLEESGRRLELSCGSAIVAGDSDLIAQGLSNLLENALRHTPAGSCVRVIVTCAVDTVELCVEDDGPGILPEQRQQVLKPFVRLEPSRNTPGSGLGLAIVAAVAARHDAGLRLEDAGPGLRVAMQFSRLTSSSHPTREAA